MFKQKSEIKYSETEIKRLKEVLLHMYLCRMFTNDYMYHPNAIEAIKKIAFMLGLNENEVLSFIYSHKQMEFTPERMEKVNALTYLKYPVTKIMRVLEMSHAHMQQAYTDNAIREAMFSEKSEMIERFLMWFEMVFQKRELQ